MRTLKISRAWVASRNGVDRLTCAIIETSSTVVKHVRRVMCAGCGWAKHIAADAGSGVDTSFAILVSLGSLGYCFVQESQFGHLILIAEVLTRVALIPLRTAA